MNIPCKSSSGVRKIEMMVRCKATLITDQFNDESGYKSVWIATPLLITMRSDILVKLIKSTKIISLNLYNNGPKVGEIGM